MNCDLDSINLFKGYTQEENASTHAFGVSQFPAPNRTKTVSGILLFTEFRWNQNRAKRR